LFKSMVEILPSAEPANNIFISLAYSMRYFFSS
jgi:hypothetical protein